MFIDLSEHRGKPDPAKVAEREAAHKRGIERSKNARRREAEAEAARKERERRRANMTKEELARDDAREERERIAREKEENQQVQKSTQKSDQQKIEKQMGYEEKMKAIQEAKNKNKQDFSINAQQKIAKDQELNIIQTQQRVKVEEEKKKIEKSREEIKSILNDNVNEARKEVKQIESKNKRQSEAISLIDNSIDNIQTRLNDSVAKAEESNIEEIIDTEFEELADSFDEHLTKSKQKFEDDWDIDFEVDKSEKEDSVTEDEYDSEMDQAKEDLSNAQSLSEWLEAKDAIKAVKKKKFNNKKAIKWLRFNYYRAVYPIIKTERAFNSFFNFVWGNTEFLSKTNDRYNAYEKR